MTGIDLRKVSVKPMREEQVQEVARIGSLCFSGLRNPEGGKRWIECNFHAYPRMQYFVAMCGGVVLGYILWMEKGGFREQAVLELEQIGVLKDYRGNGIGTKLVKDSFEEMKRCIKARGSELKLVEVSTGTENDAQKLYAKTLGAKPECVIKDLYREDEVLMIARFQE